MVRIILLREANHIRRYLRSYLREVLHESIDKCISHHPTLKKEWFVKDTHGLVQGHRMRVMGLDTLKEICDQLHISLLLIANDIPTHIVDIDLSRPNNPGAVVSPTCSERQSMVAQGTFVPALSLGSLHTRLGQDYPDAVMALRFDDYVDMDCTIATDVNPNGCDTVMVGYIKTMAQYKLMLHHLVYYTRPPLPLGNLPDYLIVLPSSKMKVNPEQRGEAKQFAIPFGIRVFRIDKTRTKKNGPNDNQIFEQWGYQDYDHNNQHVFVYIQDELSDYGIDQEEGSKVLQKMLKLNQYATTLTTFDHLIDMAVLLKKKPR